MPPRTCQLCHTARALVKRPKTGQQVCKECFFWVFETEVHNTITTSGSDGGSIFRRGEKVAIGASGGKDSTVLAHVMTVLNERYAYGLELFLLSIDEGITGYRDDSLETVKQNQREYDLPLKILSYQELYGYTMDRIVSQIGRKNNCTFCGVFRRQALDRGAGILGVEHIVTGHNADDIAETVLMNIMRGDIARLSRCTSIVTQGDDTIRRSKPFKYAYEKEIVMYAYFKKLTYFSTECIYSPDAYRGHARVFLKDLEAVRPSAIIDIIHSGEAFEVGEVAQKGMKAMQTCLRCGYISSNDICKACALLEGLEMGLDRSAIKRSQDGGAAATAGQRTIPFYERPASSSTPPASGSATPGTEPEVPRTEPPTPTPEAVERLRSGVEHVHILPDPAQTPSQSSASTSTSYSIPTKQILSTAHLKAFQESETHRELVGFVDELNESVKGRKLSEAGQASPAITSILSLLDRVHAIATSIPPVHNPLSRFGNPAFQTFYDAVSTASTSLHTEFLSPASGLAKSIPDEAIPEVETYFKECWGNRQRIDYGSGMELNFLCWLLCLRMVGVLSAEDDTALVLKVFWRYIQIMRHLQQTYWLEPAGSHGVWGLDDYHFLPFLLGASQLDGHKHLRPKAIHDSEVMEAFGEEYMYLACVAFINSIKTASLRWHSPMLDDISAVKTWSKVNSGMLKMYHAEVLGKLPVMQHFLFGSLLPFPADFTPPLDSDEQMDEHGHVHGKKGEAGWTMDCCGIPVPSAFGAAAALEQGKDGGGRGGGAESGLLKPRGGLKPIPFD